MQQDAAVPCDARPYARDDVRWHTRAAGPSDHHSSHIYARAAPAARQARACHSATAVATRCRGARHAPTTPQRVPATCCRSSPSAPGTPRAGAVRRGVFVGVRALRVPAGPHHHPPRLPPGQPGLTGGLLRPCAGGSSRPVWSGVSPAPRASLSLPPSSAHSREFKTASRQNPCHVILGHVGRQSVTYPGAGREREPEREREKERVIRNNETVGAGPARVRRVTHLRVRLTVSAGRTATGSARGVPGPLSARASLAADARHAY